ncbi:hypothetical protein HIM_07060 [Hirsutella minnesotensis 3608]|uniref:Zn(2)-C6 fungal-type domain-containing protein n=1 Tax=Hirsutella minnesotensis 3608 TaxID=1043627 RepID=A0A0F8A4F8_9HYPO|nr:hypothetical protein HIM_07060 [Hirsutella minnesotensis 3608]
MATADDEPDRPHDEAASASLAPAPAPAPASTTAPSQTAPAASSCSPPTSAPSSPHPAAPRPSVPAAVPTTAAAAAAAAADPAPSPSAAVDGAAPDPPLPPPRQPSPAASPTPTSLPLDQSPGVDADPGADADAVAASASRPQLDGDDGSASGSEANNMSTHSPALSATHHGVALNYQASTSASPPLYSPPTNMSAGAYASYSSAASSQSVDAYRASSMGAGGPMSLPSMRTMDHMSQLPMAQSSATPHHTMSMGIGAPLAAASTAPAFYGHHAMSLPSNYGMQHEAMSRFPLPHDPRILGSRGPKKEIKRRTKTGCLTCRKRRIKCDETHPTCNNCKKSKRECLGYDPVYRQPGGGVSANSHIQPAPASQSTASPSVPSSTSTHSTPSAAPRIGSSYGSQPSVLPSSHTPSPATTAVSASGSHATASTSYSPPISVPAPASFVKTEPGYDSSSARQLPPTPLSDTSRAFEYKPASLSDASAHLRAKKMKINEIIDLLGLPPPPQQISHTEETFNEITMVYHEMYAGGLSAFFESPWFYFSEGGKMSFPKDANLIEHMASFLKILEAVKANDHTQMAYSGALETRIVWELACTAYQGPDRTNTAMRTALPADGDATEVRNRLRVVEALLCGDYLAANPLAPPIMDGDQHRTRQFDFWYSLAEFVRRRDNPGTPESVKAREDMLSRMRHLLDGRENRDVLYSIAVVRELAPNFDSAYGAAIPQHLDETDPKNRLAVASKFILDEAQVTGGTTNVVRRFSDIAARAFVNPGVNIARRS